MSALVIPYHGDYGAPELKRNYRKFLTRGLLAAAAFHFTAIGAYWASIALVNLDEPPKKYPPLLEYEWIPQPPIFQVPDVDKVPGGGEPPEFATPVAVSDDKVEHDRPFPTQEEIYKSTTGDDDGGGWEDADIVIGVPPDTFVVVEKDPNPIIPVYPPYPEIARRAGLQGTVVLRVWVDREGKVRHVKIQKSDNDIFNQPAIDAAMQWVFTPALMKSGPVPVWVSIPFRFKLQGQ